MAGTDPAGELLRLSAYRFAESGRPNRQQHTVGNAARALADPAHLGVPTPRVYLDDLRLYADGHAVAGEAAKKSIKRCRQRHGANFGDRLTLPNCITDAGFCAKDTIKRCVDVAVAGMPGDV